MCIIFYAAHHFLSFYKNITENSKKKIPFKEKGCLLLGNPVTREADNYLISFEVPTEIALVARLEALKTAAFSRKVETSFLVVRSSSRRFSTLVVTSSAFTFTKVDI